MTNRDKLKQIKQDYKLTRPKMAGMLYVPLSTFNSWMLPETSKASRPCPDMAIELLNCLLKNKKP